MTKFTISKNFQAWDPFFLIIHIFQTSKSGEFHDKKFVFAPVCVRMSLENWKDIGYRTYLNHNTPWIDSQGSLEVFVVLLDNTLRDIIVISLSLTIKPVLQGNKQKVDITVLSRLHLIGLEAQNQTKTDWQDNFWPLP